MCIVYPYHAFGCGTARRRGKESSSLIARVEYIALIGRHGFRASRQSGIPMRFGYPDEARRTLSDHQF